MSRPANEPLYDDEVSLRDLYLILRRGLPFILGAAVVVGAIVYVASSFRPNLYEAESTTLVAPQPLQIQGTQNLTFEPPNEVSFEAYETLANSRAVAEEAVAEVAEAVSLEGEVSLLLGPRNASDATPLNVTHSVRNQDPELAAQLADAWALSTLDAVRASLLASLEPISSATRQQLETLEGALETAEAEFETFQRTDRGGTITALLTSLAEQIARSEEQRDEVARELADAQARVALLLESAGSESAVSGSVAPESELSTAELADRLGLLRSEMLAPDDTQAGSASEQARQLEQLSSLLSLQDESPLTGSVTGLLNRADLRSFTVDIAGLEAEQARIAEQLEAYQTRLDELLAEAAQLNLQRSRLERTLTNAQNAYDDVALLEPIIGYVTTIAPANARLLNRASIPSSPEDPRTLSNAALAAALAALLATLFVFLREAVRAPAVPPTAPPIPPSVADKTEPAASPAKPT